MITAWVGANGVFMDRGVGPICKKCPQLRQQTHCKTQPSDIATGPTMAMYARALIMSIMHAWALHGYAFC